MQPVIVTQVKMLLTGPSEPPPTAIIPHRMKPLVAAPEPLREATEVVPTVAPVAPAATPPEVSIHKTVAPHPASAGASERSRDVFEAHQPRNVSPKGFI